MATDDPRLSKLITEGDSGEVVIVGCPYDFFRKRAANKGGEDLGPCCLRRFYPKVGPLVNAEYEIDISKLKVTDMGNIKGKEEEEDQFKNVATKRFKGQFVNYFKESPEMIIDKISDTLVRLIKNNQLPFIFGGSKQAMVAGIDAFHGAYPDSVHKNVYILSGKPFLDRLYDGNKATSQNICTFLNFKYPNTRFKLFGIHNKYFPSQFLQGNKLATDANWEKFPNFSSTTYSEIRMGKGEEGKKLGRRTQAIRRFEQIYQTEELGSVNISLEVLQLFMGCRDVSVEGLSFEQLMEIMLFLGGQPQLKCVSISQFNPSCEDYESSLLILNAVYYFLMGRARANHQ